MIGSRVAATAFLAWATLAAAAPRPGSVPADEPVSSFDYSDRFYADHGVDAGKIRGRLPGGGGASVSDRAPNPDRRGLRSLETRGGYDSTGCAVYFHARGVLGSDGFRDGPEGRRGRETADRFKAFVFPRWRGTAGSQALSNLRQEVLFDTTPGGLDSNPLGLWRLTFVGFTDSVFSSPEGLAMLDELRQRNGTDLDGTPMIKHVSEVVGLEKRGFVRLDGSEEAPWVLWPLVADPRREGIAPDAYWRGVLRPDGAAADPEIEQNFISLSRAGVFAFPWMPKLAPFVQDLPLPPTLEARAPLDPPPDGSGHQGYVEFPPVKFFEIRQRAFTHRFHPDLPPSVLWGYEGRYPGPTIRLRRGDPVVVRCWNDLPIRGNDGFGHSRTICRFNLFPAAPESDGFPSDFYPPGRFKDHHFTALRESPGIPATPATGWYHDGRLGFAAQNTYKGLAGFLIGVDEVDSGDEQDPNPRASRLPSGLFDVPLLLSDRNFDATLNHSVSWDPFEMEGVLGEYFTVNGVVQPYFRVARRKYRFRLLNAGPSRFYDLALSGDRPFTVIADDGGLLDAPQPVSRLRLAMSERRDVIVDFTTVPLGTEVYLENRRLQTGPRGPAAGPVRPPGAPRVMKFIVDRDAPDPSRVPRRLRARTGTEIPENLATRTFVFENPRGAWTVNGNSPDLERADAVVKRHTTEIWILKNGSRDWTHPIPIRTEGRPILSPEGRPAEDPGPTELRPGEEVRLLMRFPGWTGRYLLRCGNSVHEDHGLMIRWDVEP